MIVLDNLFNHEEIHSVAINNYDAGYKAVRELIACGHRRIGHITSRFEFNNMYYRRKGYEAALNANGLQVSEANIWRVTPTLEGAYKDMIALLEQNPEMPTAFFAGNDIMAVGCIRALQERGVSIPEDVSVIGMDDLQLAQFCTICLLYTSPSPRDMHDPADNHQGVQTELGHHGCARAAVAAGTHRRWVCA